MEKDKYNGYLGLLMTSDHMYEVPIKKSGRAIKVDKEYKERLKSIYGDKFISKFSKDSLECPIMKKEVSFLICLGCKNFVRRFKGAVHCKGMPLQ